MTCVLIGIFLGMLMLLTLEGFAVVCMVFKAGKEFQRRRPKR
jgi:hypothetical protein